MGSRSGRYPLEPFIAAGFTAPSCAELWQLIWRADPDTDKLVHPGMSPAAVKDAVKGARAVHVRVSTTARLVKLLAARLAGKAPPKALELAEVPGFVGLARAVLCKWREP